MSQRATWGVVFRGIQSVDTFSLTWTFHVTSADRDTDVHIRTSTHGDIVTDIQTSDSYSAGTGDEGLDARLIERVQQLLAAHAAFKVLDEVHARDRRPASRWAA